ncbi:hypothetical protein LZ009_06640 [Ramlibacter sp. XY19]|uniref:hypothetical protein n=1 Tax=Ramlibacter paludis TaxID=2908000 RepID=UPI0023D9DD83|nr:hypothetical protein [Ramlibacter paludis]MCG2592458.1 hypothetical protein [Ramlibacter paludis]
MALPVHLLGQACEPPSDRELKMFDAAAQAIEVDDGPISNWLTIGAQRLVGYGLLRQRARDTVRICPPAAVLERIGAALTAPKGLGAGQLVEYQYQLAAQLPNPSDFVIGQIGKAAFNDSTQFSETFRAQDIRPLARSTLATFGVRAAPFREIALRQMSGDTPLGTGAAQVAAATQAPEARGKVLELFRAKLASVPASAAIPLDQRDRLLELAWAIYLSGDPDHSGRAAIHELMTRKVESRAPPFGVVEISPKRFCLVLERLGGQAAVARHQYCLDPKAPYEG